ncbi:MAG: YicC family protein [Rhodobacterales bacterium]|nr:MAG: YicC family protein [Rhodobacterales bacterium]
MIRSMTGFAARNNEMPGFSWSWELRSVNAKALDIRMRLPDWIEGLETALREQLAKEAERGSIGLTLRVQRDEPATPLILNEVQLQRNIAAIRQIESAAAEAGLPLIRCSAADLLTQRGVIDSTPPAIDTAPLRAALLADLPALLEDFTAMRRAEGQALETVIRGQLDQISALSADAAVIAEQRKGQMAETLRKNLALVLDNVDGADADRVAQELALLAVKADVTEELDRLNAHVDAALDLLGQSGAVGRKLDFLMQEFMRETNTLCSKAQSTPLTRIGLDLKAVIGQMREQVQNVE